MRAVSTGASKFTSAAYDRKVLRSWLGALRRRRGETVLVVTGRRPDRWGRRRFLVRFDDGTTTEVSGRHLRSR